MWNLLSSWALQEHYPDLSSMVSAAVGLARKKIDRPPMTHPNFQNWHWQKYWVPRSSRFSPLQVPPGAYVVNVEGEAPVAPLKCFQIEGQGQGGKGKGNRRR